MTNRILTAALGILVILHLTAGCQKPSPTSGAQSPKAWFQEMMGAIEEADEDRYRAVLVGPPAAIDYHVANFDFLTAASALKQAVTASFGEEGWSRFQDDDGAKVTFEMLMTPERLEKLRIEIDGDIANCFVGPEGGSLPLFRNQGRWFARADYGIPQEFPLARETHRFRETARILRAQLLRLESSTVTLDELDREITGGIAALEKKIFPPTPKPGNSGNSPTPDTADRESGS